MELVEQVVPEKGTDTPPRTQEEIQKEYAALCAQVGEMQYRIKTLEWSVSQVNQRLSQLNAEAEALAKSTPSEAGQEVVPVKEEVPDGAA